MKKTEIEMPYELEVNGETYCFCYPFPVTRDEGKTYSEVARYWKKGTDSVRTYPFYVKEEDIVNLFTIIRDGIIKELTK